MGNPAPAVGVRGSAVRVVPGTLAPVAERRLRLVPGTPFDQGKYPLVQITPPTKREVASKVLYSQVTLTPRER